MQYGHWVASATAMAISSLYLAGMAPALYAAVSNAANSWNASGASSPYFANFVRFLRSYIEFSGVKPLRRLAATIAPVPKRTLTATCKKQSGLRVHPGVLQVHPLHARLPMTATTPKSALELLGLPDEPRTGRDRLVAVAVELFYRNGYGAVGVDRVIAHAGVTKTTFYKHFEGKDDLMVAAVERREEWETAAMNRAVRELAGDDPRRQLLAKLDVIDVWFNDP